MYMLWIFVIIGAALSLGWIGIGVVSYREEHKDATYPEWVYRLITIPTVLGNIMLVAFLIACPIIEARTRVQYNELLETSQMIERVIDNGEDLENIGITQTIIDYNKNIARIKASKKSWGYWSPWYKYDVEKLQYVRVPIEKQIENKIEGELLCN